MLRLSIGVIATIHVLGFGVAAAGDAPAQPGHRYDARQAVWSTPGDGRLVMLVRNAIDRRLLDQPTFITAVPLRVRVCVTNFVGTNNAINLLLWTTSGGNPASPDEPQVLHPNLGECMEIDRPAAIIVQDSTTSGSVSGYYQLLEVVSLPDKSKSTRQPSPDIEVADPPSAPTPVPCTLLQPDPSKPNPSPDYLKFCELKFSGLLPTQIGVRICTDDNFVNMTQGPPGNWPPGYLELTATDLRTVPMDSPYNYNWNPVTPVSCRDVIWGSNADKPGSRSLFFMVGPAKLVPGYDPSRVDSILINTQIISMKPAQ